jgi:hypothetical protein
MGEVMSNDVQPHEDVAERVAGEERRASARHAARSLGSVTARIIGGSQVDLVNFSNRGVLFECDSRLLIGARASVRITTPDANLIVTGRVVRSRVKGLVNGALRYDAALVLDTELGLVPAIADLPAASGDNSELDELVAFESELGATFDDPSPVEAYLAESEASLLEVAPAADLPIHEPDAEPAVDAAPDIAPEPPPIPALAVPDVEAAELEASADAEPIAFEADGEIAFEPAVEFAFDEAGEPSFDDGAVAAIDAGAAVAPFEAVEPPVAEPAGTSMFDATYMPPAVDDRPVAASQFDVRLPTLARETTPSSFFDARPSESYDHGEPSDEAAVAFEAEDGVMFEEAFEGAPIVEDPAAPEPIVADAEPAALELAAAPTGLEMSTADEPATSMLPAAAADDLLESPAPPTDTEDRVLLQFAATVPHDLAELRRIAADNQW